MPQIPRTQDVGQVLSALTDSPTTGSCFSEHVQVPGQPARCEPFPEWVSPVLREALSKVGVENLYRHQRLSVDATHAGQDVVVVTPTASGKSLCYNLPVLQTLVSEPESRAFYLFPTKALSQDQVRSLQTLIDRLGMPVRTYTYDGDTPADARTSIRTRGHVVVTNPDMLHAGILPNHPRWRKVLQDLKYVVIDEMHTYKGVFGSHVANVLRRLFRLCDFYGSRPQLICSSATISNPAEHAERLLGRSVRVIGAEDNGAPSGPKDLLLYNPPVINKELGIRKGAISQSVRLASPFVEQGIPTICFTKSRLHTEVLARYLRERFCKRPGTSHRVASYRGGYLPGLRREIERGLKDGEITCVVSTNALELGIDIGQLDVAILAGYPGSVASVWQQMGRAGRTSRRSLAILVARNSPMDQYIVNNPEFLFGAPAERALINPDNLMVLMDHLKCAVYELPFRAGDVFGGEDLGEMLGYLQEAGVVHERAGCWHWSDESYPADGVSLRSADPENVLVIDTSSGNRVIAETDRLSAQTTVHEGAIYMVESQPYQVDRLDWHHKKAYVRRVEVDHYTTAMSYSRVRVLENVEENSPREGILSAYGDVYVARKTVGYKKIKLYTSENCGFGDVHLPDIELHTTSFWLTLSGAPLAAAGYRGMDVVDGLLGFGRILRHLAAMHLMCSASDLGLSMADPEDASVGGLEGTAALRARRGGGGAIALGELRIGTPTVFLYDVVPGGVGLAEGLYGLAPRLWEGVLNQLECCQCDDGCPSCVGPIGEVDSGARATALDLARWIAGQIALPAGPPRREEERATA